MIWTGPQLPLPECAGKEGKNCKYLETAYYHEHHHGHLGNGVEVGIIAHVS